MKSSKLLFIALLTTALSISAQERKTYVYEGRVVNESGIPIKDAVVKAIETNVSATTEYDGLFSLTLPIKGDSIVITKEGLATFSGRTIVKTIEKPVQKVIEKIIQATDGSLEKQVTKEYNPEFIYEPLEKEVIVLGPLQASRMTVEAYTKKMAETATKYYEAGLNFLSGDAPDYMKAFACFTRAANMEHDQAAYQLAKMYDEGLGIPQDHAKATKWFEKSASNKVYEMVETNAQFPGGDEECLKFLAANVRYPTKCQEKGIQGRVIVSFVVNRDGSIVDVKTISSPDIELAKEAERIVRIMPKWTPASQGGRTVRSRFSMPVMFRLN